MQPRPLVTVIIPCYNEATSIEKVLSDFHKITFTITSFDFEILVIDNASTDGTAQVAAQGNARVIHEPKKGKGFAIRTGFANLGPNTKYVIMIDGDDTYCPLETMRLLEPLQHDFCDAVVGSRLGGKIHGASMSFLSRTGNWGFTHLTRLLYRINVTDVLSGYFAWKRHIIDELAPHLNSSGFAIEMEMITKMSHLNYEVYSVPISYQNRIGKSNLRPFHDGARILLMLIKNIFWNRPQQFTKKRAILKEEL